MTTINHHPPASARLASTSTTPKAKSSRRSQSVQYTTMALKKWTDTPSAEEDGPSSITSPAAWRTHNRGASSGDNSGWFGLSELSPPGTPSDTGILHRKLKEKEAEIIRLGNEVSKLREELSVRPTQEDLDSVRNEWQTSEELFSQSQRDNEQKHMTIENQRQYIRVGTRFTFGLTHQNLEHKLEETLGESWKEFITPSPLSRSTSFNASTPVGKSAPHRSSVSFKRASRARPMSSIELGRGLSELASLPEPEVSTPASALRKLEGTRESTESGADSPVSSLSEVTKHPDYFHLGVTRPSPQQIVHGFGQTPVTERKQQAEFWLAQFRRILEQMSALAALVKALPGSVAEQIEAATERGRERAEEANLKVEVHKQVILELLDAAEQRSELRELRLQGILAEAKACSGQMEW
ncbi:uncharacterized protein LOC62_02G002424 [Vanrija pseudolonga]|uniref:Uncharacterized protein n=1 Tax=Vanrija pseudolonga TaxID=143232 RepID=A0AAF1BIL6_9TREE|nr:hypothetical protein LOC62_02G002424 [Vanrija pseudolonga]